MLKQISIAVRMLALMTILTGLLYPLACTGLAQALFPFRANGSLIVKQGVVLGSELIGQPFGDPKYFWGRPSATTPFPDNALASSGSNLGPLNPTLAEAVKTRIATLRSADPKNLMPVPIDLVTASGSGLDPDISPAAAEFQLHRVAQARGMDEKTVRDLIAQCMEWRQYTFFGEPGINVLKLNLALDALPRTTGSETAHDP